MAVAEFTLADVFGTKPYSGNSLAVFDKAEDFTVAQRHAITQEMRHFESVFLHEEGHSSRYRAHIHTAGEELDFAGHPLIGAAAVLHAGKGSREERTSWRFVLNRRSITIATERRGAGWWAEMDQGQPDFLGAVPSCRKPELLAALDCRNGDLCDDLPIEVVSTGLPYLIVPLCRGLDRARIATKEFSALLRSLGAQFVYLLDVAGAEGRTWDNGGVVEDVATGSAAGPVGAYLTKHRRLQPGHLWTLRQGRFAGRPSELFVRTIGSPDRIDGVSVSGNVFVIGRGRLHILPDP